MKITCEPEEDKDAKPVKKLKKEDAPCKVGSRIEQPEKKQVEIDTLACKELPGQKKVVTDALKDSSEEKWLQLDANGLSQYEWKEFV